MKTIKKRVLAGKCYVFTYEYLEKGWGWVINSVAKCSIEDAKRERNRRLNMNNDYRNVSEFTEIETFREVEEQVPHVFERWVFAATKKAKEESEKDKEEILSCSSEMQAISAKASYGSSGYECTPIQHIKVEF